MSTKVKSITPKTYEGKVTGYSIVLENGTEGYLDDKGSDKELKPGDDIEFILVVKQNKKGKDYNLLTLKKVSQSATPPSEPAKAVNKPSPGVVDVPEVVKLKTGASIKAMEFVVNAFIADKINYDKIKEYYTELKGYLFDSIDEITGKA
jgi:hypothetical protein